MLKIDTTSNHLAEKCFQKDFCNDGKIWYSEMELNQFFEKQLWNIIFLPICWTQHTDPEWYMFLEKNIV